MKIVNVKLSGPHNDNAGYQGNLLPKWQKRIGNEVTIIASCMITNRNNAKFSFIKPKTYINEDGIKVIRLKNRRFSFISKTFNLYDNLYETLEKEKPDFLFIHGCQFLDAITVCRYLKFHQDVIAVVDNHADKTNSALNLASKLLHKTLWRYTAQKLNKFVSCFYGVLPVRQYFLNEMYGIPLENTRLLVMGADDDLVNKLSSELLKKDKNTKNSKQLTIIAGGKFDEFKTEILNLMEVVKNKDNVKLIVFGSIGDAIKTRFDSLMNKNIEYLGWLNQNDIYKTILSGDIIAFPGRHSVLWEQCVALGVPLMVKKLPGTDHIDIGGNCIFLEDSSKNEIENIIDNLLKNPNVLLKLKKSANKKEKENFLYSNIAGKSLECYYSRNNKSI